MKYNLYSMSASMRLGEEAGAVLVALLNMASNTQRCSTKLRGILRLRRSFLAISKKAQVDQCLSREEVLVAAIPATSRSYIHEVLISFL